MADDRKKSGHRVTMDDRERIFMTGVLDVISFDEENIIAETEMGALIIRGDALHVNKLNLEEGELIVDGAMTSLTYNDHISAGKSKSSFLSRLFK